MFRGHVDNDGTNSSGARPLDTPEILTGDDLAAYTEALGCLSVGASTAAVTMCRKLLFHIAVRTDFRKRTTVVVLQTSAKALKHFEEEGVTTKHMRPWVVKIGDVGKGGQPRIPSTTTEQATEVALFPAANPVRPMSFPRWPRSTRPKPAVTISEPTSPSDSAARRVRPG